MKKQQSPLRTASLRALLGCAATLTATFYVESRDFTHVDGHEFLRDDDLELWQLFGRPAPTDYIVINGDTIRFPYAAHIRAQALNETDYREVAAALGVDVASIKAVVDIETGRNHRGFNVDETPVINFDLKVFKSLAARRNINLNSYIKSHPLVFSAPDIKSFGSQQAAQHARLQQAMDIDSLTAIEATFWGMFQIGGFNWKRCGTSSPTEFVELMSKNERDQLDLFAAFIINTGLKPYLEKKNWSAFARGYNGPSYAARGYHKRLAASYKRYVINNH